ncbi:MAG: ABC transporter ATP-binding protein [Gammaproteobacteria bacterium]|nr:ABC transporter ATP-binding protein [Gammaproteobacteria bacterium]MBU1416082.1 ABC transporter ATP-binding protein [Gammaproteobacteria bacterium]
MADENIIEVQDLYFSYGDNRVLHGLDLRVQRGKVVAILGVSGSGKSTLLKLIGGQIKPQHGTVRVNGEIVGDMDSDGLYALRREMGMMFQSGGLFSDISVYENIAFPLRELTDLPDDLIHRMVLMKLHAVGLRGASTLMPNELSGGMARRVALARAIALDPQLIMYDEPFAGLDPISLNVIAHLIRSLNDALDVTSIIVSYDVMESLMVADYAYFIHDGALVAEGTSQEILASKDPFVHQFVNAQPDGPVAFHHPARPLREALRLA